MKRVFLWMVATLAVAVLAAATWPPARAILPPELQAWLPQIELAGGGEAPKQTAQKKGPPPAPVAVATATLTEMPVVITAPATVEPLASVAIKPRVDGQIAEVLFREGDLVEKGQVLYRLDDRLVLAQIQQAEANIKRDEASLTEAEAVYGRRSTLVQKKIVAESAMDTARTSVDTLKANIAAGKAALEAQKTQLDYLVIRSPLRGRTGTTSVKLGANIRAAEATPLVTINQTQPVLVAFAVPQAELAALRRALSAGATADIQVAGKPPEIRKGRIVFVDNQVDKATGTVTAKVEAPNADEFLWPGQAVEVALTVEVQKDKLTLPASAVLPSQQGMIVWVVGPDNRVEPREVSLDRVVGQTAYLNGGIKAGDVVVTDGQVRIAPGATVSIQGKGPPGKTDPKSEPKAEGKGQRGDRRS